MKAWKSKGTLNHPMIERIDEGLKQKKERKFLREKS